MSELPDEVATRLREAGGLELLHLLDTWGERLDAATARQVLRNPHCGDEAIRALLTRRHLLSSYEVRRDVALHPRTPQTPALQLVSGLYWRDLVSAGLDSRLPPLVRRAAELRLLERVSGLAVGEKVSIARRASHGILQRLRHDPTPRVIGAMLENPRLTEGVLLPLVSSESASPAVLTLIAEDPRWGVRYPIRVALAKNPQTPVTTALKILPLLKKSDLRGMLRQPRLPMAVRQRAALLVGEVG